MIVIVFEMEPGVVPVMARAEMHGTAGEDDAHPPISHGTVAGARLLWKLH